MIGQLRQDAYSGQGEAGKGIIQEPVLGKKDPCIHCGKVKSHQFMGYRAQPTFSVSVVGCFVHYKF